MNPFTFHTGIHFNQAGSQQKGACIFCHKEDHFFFNDQFLWDCKYCKKHGNLYTFINLFITKCTENIEALAIRRGLPLNVFKLSNIKYNPYLSTPTSSVYVIPTYNEKAAINNIYKVCQRVDDPTKLMILATPGLESTLFNYPASPSKEIWLCEGHWDKLAAEAIIGGRNITCVGFPGATFKANWTRLLHGRKVIIFGDNDAAGKAVNKMILDKIEKDTQKPDSIFYLKWPEDTPDKYDLNDLWRDKSFNSFDFIQSHIEEIEYESQPQTHMRVTVSDVTCTSFESLVESCKVPYHFTDDMELLLLVMLTALYSLKIEGEQIWLRTIGPPGSSKTTLANLIGQSDQSVMRDTFTGLLSGWKDDEDKDASLIPLIASKALIVKDADALMSQTNLNQILSQLRAFYDKDISVTYRNRQEYEYKDVRSCFILCGTHILRILDNTDLGERFIDFELSVTDHDRSCIQDRIMDRNIIAAATGLSPEIEAWSKAKGFIDHHLLNRTGVFTPTAKERALIKCYGNLISYMRAKVRRSPKGEILVKTHPEVPSRITGQLLKLYQCSPVVLNRQETTPLVDKLVTRITLDIINRDSNRYNICDKLFRISNEMTGEELVASSGLTMEVCEREVLDMISLNMVKVIKRRTTSSHMIRAFSLREDLMEQFTILEKHR